MKLINKDALIAGLEDWQYKIKKGIILVPLCGRQRADAAHEYEVIGLVKEYIDAFETKEVQEEPVSKDLEEAAVEAFKQIVNLDKNSFLEIFKAGAKWKEEQFKKNLLDVCKKQTGEESEIERDFIEGFIENERRLPTFDDAIKCGMRLQKEQMMKDAIDAVVSQVPCSNEIILYNPSSVYKYSLPQEMNELGLNKGDKVKVIIIKSE